MKYQLGDFVRFVDENLEGYVTRIISDDMIGVTGSDDFEIPVPVSKVTTVHGYKKNATEQSNAAPTTIPDELFVEKGIYLAAAPDHKTNAVVHFYLVNQTSYQLASTLSATKDKQIRGEFAGMIAPASYLKIHSAPLADLQIWPEFTLQILYFTKQAKQIIAPLTFTEKFKAKDFAGTKKSIPLLNENGWLFRLDEDEEIAIDAEKLKESFFRSATEKLTVDKPTTEVDLHIEKLRDDHQFMSSATILNFQLDHFKKTLEAAIVHQLPEVTFIHGTGNGILKHELHKLLGKNQKVQTFMDARKEKFGYGATKVILK
ncbi:Smr/MutS family protein [Mucilaginibacter myungsuensis]|uniref:Smr/MutS family protein n=1 Tax=Mucilaginibacter myungsuensis TaxID=649104 RepID=A0A929L332_9SPHI|nr:Smr/MutS family protein [Mucilaginibacter myungsuensis]MBE9663569.1 Smr/MutS family protein [Mucilaginibacter myungsuensis]MDN3599107.1 Smr/MutS family protein [Mucilaginibacter myungsuensis]